MTISKLVNKRNTTLKLEFGPNERDKASKEYTWIFNRVYRGQYAWKLEMVDVPTKDKDSFGRMVRFMTSNKRAENEYKMIFDKYQT